MVIGRALLSTGHYRKIGNEEKAGRTVFAWECGLLLEGGPTVWPGQPTVYSKIDFQTVTVPALYSELCILIKALVLRIFLH